jgi:hypothetical protein
VLVGAPGTGSVPIGSGIYVADQPGMLRL